MERRHIKLIGILAAVIVLFILLLIFEFGFCSEMFSSLVNDGLNKEQYLKCGSDGDCKVLGGCGKCVNSEGAAEYHRLKLYCIEPQWECITPKGCVCENNICTRKFN
jgi:hypothetical protein